MLTPGTLLQNRYRIKRELARGGMGAVYEAEAIHLNNLPVAVKETFFNQEGLRRQFEREAAMLARLRHAALPRVSDHFSEGSGQFLVMDFIEGHDLFHLLAENLKERKEPFGWQPVSEWADRLLDALVYIHGQHPPVIHRDIKPENIKLTPQGEIILIDFGLAKDATTPTRPGRSLHAYTEAYAPPEQIKGTGTDARSDLYALGATLYHLLTGQPPTDAKFREQVMSHSMPDPLSPVHQVRPQIPFALSAVIAKAMSFDRERRFQTAAEMRAALAQAKQTIAQQAAEEEARHQAEQLRLEEERKAQAHALAAQHKLEEERQRALEEQRLRAEAERKRAAAQRQTEPVLPSEPALPPRGKEQPAKAAEPPLRPAPVAPVAAPKSPRKLMVGLASLAVLALLLYWMWPHQQPAVVTNAGLPPTATPPSLSSSPPATASERGEVLRYSLEIEGEKRRATSLSLASGKPFRLHFSAPTNGFLYLLARDSHQVLRALLIAQPLKAGADFTDDWITPNPKSQQGNITVIFSPERITRLSFLSKAAGYALTGDDEKALNGLREQSASSLPALSNSSASNASSVIVTAAKNDQPVVFDIAFEGKRSGS